MEEMVFVQMVLEQMVLEQVVRGVGSNGDRANLVLAIDVTTKMVF